MRAGTRVRFVAAALVGLAAGVAAWARVAPLAPFLDVRTALREAPDVWEVRLTARGDDPVAGIAVGRGVGTVEVLGEAGVPRLDPGRTARFVVRATPAVPGGTAAVRITWTPAGEAPRISDHPLMEPPR
jgi:hypothetical protein